MEVNTLNIVISSNMEVPEEITRRMLVTNIIYSSLKEAGFMDVEVQGMRIEEPSLLVENFPTLLDFIRLAAPKLFSAPIVIQDNSLEMPRDVEDDPYWSTEQVFDRMDKRALKEARQAMRSKGHDTPSCFLIPD